jgi:hypothetical protein
MPLPTGILFALALMVCSGYLSVALEAPALPAFMVIGTALWVYFDGKKLGLSRYRTGLIGPEVASIGCLGVWIIAFPWYLSARHRILNGQMPLKEGAPPPEA